MQSVRTHLVQSGDVLNQIKANSRLLPQESETIHQNLGADQSGTDGSRMWHEQALLRVKANP
jgi:hypothetical protein